MWFCKLQFGNKLYFLIHYAKKYKISFILYFFCIPVVLFLVLTLRTDIVGFQGQFLQPAEISKEGEQWALTGVPSQFSVLSQCQNLQFLNIDESFHVNFPELVVVFYGDAAYSVIPQHLARQRLDPSFIKDQLW